ncbi:MAG: M23 family metallopeptidase [Pseudomonadota bacterium]
MREALVAHIHTSMERIFPEKRLFIRAGDETRFIRLRPGTQAAAWIGTAVVVGWTIVSTSILIMDSIGAGSLRDQAKRDQALYEARLAELSQERDKRAMEAHAAHERFTIALEEVSEMQTALLVSEDRRRELETGIDVIQKTLRTAMSERDSARDELSMVIAEANRDGTRVQTDAAQMAEMEATVEMLSAALSDSAREKSQIDGDADDAILMAETLERDLELMQDRNDRIFRQLEEAVATSMAPLGDMFETVGLPTDRIIEEVRRSYSGAGGPLTPISMSTKGEPMDSDTLRTNALLEDLDNLNLYRLAIENVPFSQPVFAPTRFTSGFGMRSDPFGRGRRMHNGVDFAGKHGIPIHATAVGTVVFAGWQGGYGRVVKIRHAQGFETTYAHLARISVKKGEKVSRGDRIGDMGNSGRSTGTHLHYEVRIDGKPVNPMTYIKAARDVF